MRNLTRWIIGILPLACGAEVDSSTAASMLGAGGAPMGEPTISASQIDDVWVFQYNATPGDNDEALLEGTARVEGDCLLVRDTIVIWRAENMNDVSDLVAKVNKQEDPLVSIGGGEAVEIPEAVLSRCQSSEVWYQGEWAP